jgi:hypothetical protein
MEWCWSFCRKLDRFNEKDKKDIKALLTYLNHPAIAIAQKGDVKKAENRLANWIKKSCLLQLLDWGRRNMVEKILLRIAEVAKEFHHT